MGRRGPVLFEGGPPVSKEHARLVPAGPGKRRGERGFLSLEKAWLVTNEMLVGRGGGRGKCGGVAGPVGREGVETPPLEERREPRLRSKRLGVLLGERKHDILFQWGGRGVLVPKRGGKPFPRKRSSQGKGGTLKAVARFK